MEQYEFLKEKAFEKLNTADHLLFTTYPVVRDPKLLMSVLENINTGLNYAVACVLHHQRSLNKIPYFEETNKSRLEMFKNAVAPNLGLNPSYVKLISDVRATVLANKKSPVTFVKNDKLVICSPKYDIKALDANIVKRQLFEAKLFLSNLSVIVRKNEGVVV
jgi:hypothetical protein